jgi:hypothetical protein
MALFALLEGRRREAAAWTGAIFVALATLAAHAVLATAAATPGDLASPGWLALGGLPFVLKLTHFSSISIAMPLAAQAFVLPAALLGLVLWRAPEPGLGRRMALLVLGCLSAFLFVGRNNNDYWGLLLAPIWPLGLLEIDRTVLALIRRLRSEATAPAGVALEASGPPRRPQNETQAGWVISSTDS